jgi:hypothetical protein
LSGELYRRFELNAIIEKTEKRNKNGSGDYLTIMVWQNGQIHSRDGDKDRDTPGIGSGSFVPAVLSGLGNQAQRETEAKQQPREQRAEKTSSDTSNSCNRKDVHIMRL